MMVMVVVMAVCSMLAEDAIKAAVKDLEKKRTGVTQQTQQQAKSALA
jgi:hypothetical protein